MEAEGIPCLLVPFHVVQALRNTFRNCTAPHFRAVWTGSLSATKNASERHVSSKCEHGLKPNCNDYSLAVLK